MFDIFLGYVFFGVSSTSSRAPLGLLTVHILEILASAFLIF